MPGQKGMQFTLKKENPTTPDRGLNPKISTLKSANPYLILSYPPDISLCIFLSVLKIGWGFSPSKIQGGFLKNFLNLTYSDIS